MKIALFGSTGFLGSSLVNDCHDRDLDVVSFVDISRPLSQDIFNAQAISFSEESLLQSLIGFDVVVCLIGCFSPHFVSTASEELIKCNVSIPFKLAHASKMAGVSRFIYSSSLGASFCDSNIANLCDDYGKSKLIAEQKLFSIVDSTFSVIAIRFDALFGQNHGGTIGSLLSFSRLGFIPYIKTSSSFNFLYVGDAVYLLKHIIRIPLYSSCVVSGSYGGLSASDFFSSFKELGIAKPVSFSRYIFLTFAFFGTLFEYIFKRSAPFSLRKNRMLFNSFKPSPPFSKDDFSFPFGFKEGLRLTYESQKAN